MTGKLTHRWLWHTIRPEEDGWQVREVLQRTLRFSRQMIKRVAQTDGLRLDGERPFLSNRVAAGKPLAIRLSPTTTSGLRAVPMPLDIVQEDADLLVIDKPAGLLVHPSRRSHVRTLAHGVLAHFEATGISAHPHPVHRLDRDTTGLVLFAKHPLAHQRLTGQMRAGTLRRVYLAVVAGDVQPAEGTIVAGIDRSERDPHLRMTSEAGSEAVTRYRVLELSGGVSVVQVELVTGRTHQIRVHFAELGHPLVGDAAYGGPGHPAIQRQALHAWRLSFVHPITGEAEECAAGVPADLRELLDQSGAAVPPNDSMTSEFA